MTPHGTSYLEDGNVEVLYGNTLFYVRTSTLSFHSPALRRMFVEANLDAAELSNGCPRILFSDTAKDFTTLLKMIYLPGFVVPPILCLSTDSLEGTMFRISPRSLPSSGWQQSMTYPLYILVT